MHSIETISNMIIVVTGTPGTGKTTFAKRYVKDHDAYYVDVNDIISRHGLSEGYDEEKRCKIIDVDKLNEKLIVMIRDANMRNIDLVIDSHLAHELSPETVDEVIVTKCEPNELQERLSQRGYSRQKIRENLDAELFDICLHETQEKKHKIRIVHTDTKKS